MKRLLLLVLLTTPLFPMAEFEPSLTGFQEEEPISYYSVECPLCNSSFTALSPEILFDLFGNHAMDAHNIAGQGSIEHYFEAHYEIREDESRGAYSVEE